MLPLRLVGLMTQPAAGDRDTKRALSVLLLFSVVLLQLLQYDSVSGHGRLVEPPSRASMWRYGYDTKPDFHDNQLWCGGFAVCWLIFTEPQRRLSYRPGS